MISQTGGLEVSTAKTNYYLIDVLKLFFSLCVVALHTNLFLSEAETLYWYSSHVIWRIAVPFFFISSGYFFCLKVKAAENPSAVLKASIKRLLILLLFWLCITLPLEIHALTLKNYTMLQIIFDLMKRSVLYPWGALWYILALIIAYLLIYPFLKKGLWQLPLLLGGFLYLFALICNSYYFVIENTFIQGIVDRYLDLFLSARNGLFLGFFYLATANYLTVKKPFSKHTNILLLCIGTAGLVLETYVIRECHYKDDHSLFLSLLPVVISLFELAKSKVYPKNGKLLRNLSIGVYVLHRPVLGYLNYFFSLSKRIGSIPLFMIVAFISILLAYLLQKIENPYIKRLIT